MQHIYIMSSFQDFFDCVIFNPTFHFVACGAEIFRPFGTCICESLLLLAFPCPHDAHHFALAQADVVQQRAVGRASVAA
ncbi:hypothetical protein Barb6_01683 [Bacteroidales bacterium Barb6]|nr:hypothetical protein Barb6_01683 [Bacteroidales bacterium Barb6]